MPKGLTSEIDARIGARVRMRRMMIGMSQQALGAALGITFQQVQKYEKGTNRIGAGRLFQIAEIMGGGISFFVEGATAEVRAADGPDFVRDFLATSRGLSLARAFQAINDPATKSRVVDLVEQIVAGQA